MRLNWKKNLGDTDSAIRAIIAILLLALVFAGKVTGGWAAAAALFAISQFVEIYFSY